MKSLFCITAAVILLALAAGCGQEANREMEKANLLQTDIDFAKKSMESTASEAFEFYLAEDAVQLPNEMEPIFGREAIVAEIAEYDKQYQFDWEPQMAEVAAMGDLGYTWGKYKMFARDENQTLAAQGKYVTVWKKQPDGKWKVVMDIGNTTPMPAAPAEES